MKISLVGERSMQRAEEGAFTMCNVVTCTAGKRVRCGNRMNARLFISQCAKDEETRALNQAQDLRQWRAPATALIPNLCNRLFVPPIQRRVSMRTATELYIQRRFTAKNRR